MMISPWWLQLIRPWSHICFFCLSPTFHPCRVLSVVDWWFQTKTFCSKPTTTSESKGSYSALPGNYNTKSKALQISRGLSYPDISGVLEFMHLWQLESMSNTGPCFATGTQAHNPCTKLFAHLQPILYLYHVINHILWELQEGGCCLAWLQLLSCNLDSPPRQGMIGEIQHCLSPHPGHLDLGPRHRTHPSSPVAHKSKGQTWLLPCSWPE